VLVAARARLAADEALANAAHDDDSDGGGGGSAGGGGVGGGESGATATAATKSTSVLRGVVSSLYHKLVVTMFRWLETLELDGEVAACVSKCSL
jgi:hypothetical protein